MRNKIPKHWQVKKLGGICEILDNKRKPINSSEREMRLNLSMQRFPYFGATGQVGFIDDYIFDFEAILLGEDGAPFLDFFKKKAYIVSGKYWVNNHAHILKAINGISTNHFVCYFLNSINYAPYVSGTTRLKLNQESMKNIEIPLPPLDEQNLIVKKIESCFEKIDFAISNFKKSKELIEIYKQSVLSHAFNGKLTNSNLNSWQVKKLGEIFDIFRGGSPRPIKSFLTDDENGVNWIKIGDVGVGSKYITQTKQKIHKDGLRQSREVKIGDLLLTNSMSYGRPYISKINGAIHDGWLVFQPKFEISKDYVFYFFTNSQTYKKLSNLAVGSTVKNLQIDFLGKFEIPLPPLSEQNLIVAQIEKRFKAADNALNLIEQNLKKAEILKQSILSKAFNGELVKDKNE
ncbi:restriction endonuclease subunit S [uncultured Campylobacter sp.]|uniref:restriction endonuclease subunit S n=1 Tax=uncultured Campylobacter sp. TaxID=218934 RepID=UPI002622C76D|nr:restriction endonuclease subunit S [uncultured Campylobacter sp.]